MFSLFLNAGLLACALEGLVGAGALVLPVSGVPKASLGASRLARRADMFGAQSLNNSQDLSYLTNMCVPLLHFPSTRVLTLPASVPSAVRPSRSRLTPAGASCLRSSLDLPLTLSYVHSADLWIEGVVSQSTDTGVFGEINYAVGAAAGPIRTATVEFSGYTVQNQPYSASLLSSLP
jgi:hypothetical protein